MGLKSYELNIICLTMLKVLLIVLACIVCFGLFVMILDSNRFVIVDYDMSDEKIRKEHRLVFLSDLHAKSYGKDNKKLLDAIEMLDPEAILIGGDMINAYPGSDFEKTDVFIKKLSDKFPLYYALGNHEYRAKIYPENYGSLYDDYLECLSKSGVRLMDNENRDLSEDICIYGLSISANYYKRIKKQYMDDDYVKSEIGERKEDKFSILLAHNPDYFENYAKWGADLTLSGHVHGGVVRVPGWKGVISPRCVLFPKYDGGRFSEFSKEMIISRGLGMHTIPFRMFNPGELVVINLKPQRLEENQ